MSKSVGQNDKDKREKAFRAARMAAEDVKLSVTEAAKRCGASRATTHEAFILIRFGTPEEIASGEANEIGLRNLGDQVRKRVPLAGRERKKSVKSTEYTQNELMASTIWGKLRDALDLINSLPQPADVVTIAKINHMRGKVLNEKLIPAYSWLTEFSDAWTK